ncbi:hypothetical protein, partial [Alicyclobacillus acidocaldarius]|uniref:hypothetical protein n=1 Tax=Alicyclobacillus acidocaldarius TaxID=405212 RepID=UPI00345E9F3A
MLEWTGERLAASDGVGETEVLSARWAAVSAEPGWLKNVLLPIGAAERYDVEFRVPPSGAAYLISADPDATARQELRAA